MVVRVAEPAAGFTIPDSVRLDGTRLYVPKVGWVRLAGNHGRYLGCLAKQVRLRKEGDEHWEIFLSARTLWLQHRTK